MPHFLVALLALLALGCAPDERPADAPVAWVDGDTLTVQGLAEFLVLAQPMDLTPEEAEAWVEHWVEVSAFATGLARGRDFLEPDMTRELSRLEVQEALVQEHLARVSPEEASLAPHDVDSIYQAGELRLVGHIFRRAPSSMPAPERERQGELAQRLHRLLAETGQLSVVNLDNQDEVAQVQGGIRLIAPGDLPPDLEEVAYALDPGQLSGLVETGLGYHIVFRPPLDEGVQDTFVHLLTERLREEAELDYLDRMLDPSGTELAHGSIDRVRRIAGNPVAFIESDSLVARHPQGVLESGEVARFLLQLPPGGRRGLSEAAEEEIEELIHQLVARNRLVRVAEEDPAVDAQEIRTRAEQRYREEIARLWRHARLWPDSLQEAAAHEDARVRLAQWRVQQYLEAVAARRSPMEALPPLLTARLLQEARWTLDRARLGDALAMAERLLAAAGYTDRGDLPAGTGESRP